MSKKQPPRKKTARILEAATIAGIGTLRLVRFGTYFYMTLDGTRLDTVRTSVSARRRFEGACKVLKRRKVAA